MRDLIPLHLFGLQGPGCQIGDLLLQYLPIPGDRAVAAQHPGQPQQVVRDAGPYTGPCRRVPPVLDIPLLKLTGGGQQQLFSGALRPGIQERGHILKLVPEAEGAAVLVLGGPRHQSAGSHLVQAPAVEVVVQRPVRGGQGKGGHPLPPPCQGLAPQIQIPLSGKPGFQPSVSRLCDQSQRQSLGKRAGHGLTLSHAVGECPACSCQGEGQDPLCPNERYKRLCYQPSCPHLLFPPCKARSVGDRTGTAVAISKDRPLLLL